jgi:hypothetical protein
MELPTHILLDVRLPAALRLGSGGAVGHSAARHAGAAGRRSALRRARVQLSAGACWPAWPRRSWQTAPGSSSAAAMAIMCCACSASYRWNQPPASAARRTPLAAAAGHADDCQVCARPGHLAPPVAGQNGMGSAISALRRHRRRAVAGTLLAAGRFFGDLLQRNPSLLDWAGRFSARCWSWAFSASSWPRLRRRMVLKS